MKLSEMTLEQLKAKRAQIEKFITERMEEKLALPASIPASIGAWTKDENDELSDFEGTEVLHNQYSFLNDDGIEAVDFRIRVFRVGKDLVAHGEYWLHMRAYCYGLVACQIKMLGTPHIDNAIPCDEDELSSLDLKNALEVGKFCKRHFGVNADPATFIHCSF